ncbi:UvrD-helicase domain-containing protein [Aquibacillus koreensis]|uniref:UvrD-helicase domain-containing protein n=1 Tax=Aquibacillus koreensis TaxID=279446 RepID=A0A9X4AIE2_9BACI|nr:RNA polymerase recycling motor HelD [Aquibacillus koreensis]MCT2538160.1 UvrD-helicase domain-containing protein [Aquibacillus koreensis]MDC3420896.1 UvrD-helicase domain-containing protein [Aquibacillus koreensis]
MSEEKDWQDEKQRVDQVIHVIRNKMEQLKDKAGDLKEKVIDIRKDFWDDVTVNLDDPDDIIETQASLKQQAEFLSERERSHGHMSKQIDTLQRLEDSPYFGRIDFVEKGYDKPESIYIGIASLMDEQDDDFLIYDWRAPISNLYYDYPPGEAKYKTIDEEIEGEITLKRQFIIRNSVIKGMFDTGLTIGDHLLQSVLGNTADTKMKSIVATIQQEQNQIIRNEKSDLLIVQGVAGSGKTSAALQRVAYLLYRYREVLSSENIVLFSPNPLFNSYVAKVLPELGEENMKQTTLFQYLDTQIGNKLTVETPFAQMEYYLSEAGKNYAARVQAMSYKASLNFKQMIDDFGTSLEQDGVIFRNIRFRGDMFISKQQIKDYFYSLEETMSIPLRMEEVAKWLLTKLTELEREQREEDWVIEEMELLDKSDYLEVHNELQDETRFSEDTFDDHVREEDLLRKKVVADKIRPLKEKVKRKYFVDVKKTYIQLFTTLKPTEVDHLDLPEKWEEICKQTEKFISKNYLTWEDATPYLYFQKMLLGFNANRTIQHVFIDEAQDYSPFQFAYLKKIFPSSRMTLLGDINQAIYAHAIEEETLLSENIETKHERITLTRSYRSTKPIVEFTKAFMPNGHLIEPFNRDGAKPVLMEVENTAIANDKIETAITDFQTAGHQTIAVICKTMIESNVVYHRLKHKFDVRLMDEETHTFQQGILVIPAYLAKGIEFDAVIIHDASDQVYHKELEKNLFYTACTRAMHDLLMISLGEPSAFIKEVPREKYTHYKIHAIRKGQ